MWRSRSVKAALVNMNSDGTETQMAARENVKKGHRLLVRRTKWAAKLAPDSVLLKEIVHLRAL